MVVQAYLNTAIESIPANGCHALGYGYGCQTTTTIESRLADGCHALGYGYGCQTTTTIESRLADGRHALGNGEVFDLLPVQVEVMSII